MQAAIAASGFHVASTHYCYLAFREMIVCILLLVQDQEEQETALSSIYLLIVCSTRTYEIDKQSRTEIRYNASISYAGVCLQLQQQEWTWYESLRATCQI